MADGSTTCRRPPLYTCGVSTLAIVWNLFYKRSLEINGPIGSVARRLAKLGSRVSPLMCVIQYQLLATLLFFDGYILSMEKIVEKYVPLTRHVFDTIDNMVDKVDNLPKDFEHLMEKLHGILHKILVLDGAKEKEIRVDTRSDQNGGAIIMPTMKCSYKEALEKGVKEDGVEREYDAKKEVNNEDPLLELLHYGWETPRTRHVMSRSASYT